MARSRPILIQIWNDPDFQEYNIQEKLVFIFIFTNEIATQSGVYQLTFKDVFDKTGVSKNDSKEIIIKSFQKKVVYDQRNSIIWVKNYLRHNCINKNPCNVIRSILIDYKATKRSSAWKGYWEYNGDLIESLVKKSCSLQKKLSDGKIVLPDSLIKTCSSLDQYINKTSLRVAQDLISK